MILQRVESSGEINKKYIYQGYKYDRYDGAYLLGFRDVNSDNIVIWWWYDNEPRKELLIAVRP